MVYRNNNLENSTTFSEGEVPVYPFFVDVPSCPERKYLVGMYRFARIVYVALFVAMVFCVLTVFRAFSRDVSPKFIKWNDLENSYEFVPLSYSKKPKSPIRNISYSEYLNQYFIRTYIQKKFSVSTSAIENYNNWCDCKNKTPSKMGMFNVNEECYLCMYSDQSIYKSFVDNMQNAYSVMFDNNISRSVEVLDINFERGSVTSTDRSVIEWILNKTKPVIITQNYRVDFVVTEFKDNKESKEVLTGYVTIRGNKFKPQSRKVVAESFMFNPNSDLVLKSYEEDLNAIK